MSEDLLDTFFDKIVQVLLQDVAFYIPSEIIPSAVYEKIQHKIPAHFLDELTILDIQHGFVAFEIEEFNKRIIQKPNYLEKNIFQLLKKRKELDTFELDYILKKYFDKVEFYAALINWLSENLSIYNKEKLDPTIIGLFEIQNEAYKKHLIELIDTFYSTSEIQLKEAYHLPELLKAYLPELISRFGKYSKTVNSSIIKINPDDFKDIEKTNQPLTNTIVEKIQKPIKKKIKKEPLITDEEAEDFLLRTVFNMKN